MNYTTANATETMALGEQLAGKLQGKDTVCLHGELGSGKTTFVKGLAKGLGITDSIVSPTFTLLQLYRLPRQQHDAKECAHIDTYRLKTEAELIAIGAEDYIGAPYTITVIEWPEKIPALLKNKNVVNIYFDHAIPHNRTITMPEEYRLQ